MSFFADCNIIIANMEPCFKKKLITPTESYEIFVQVDQLETGKNKRLQKKLKKC
jgi:hypothetical protein